MIRVLLTVVLMLAPVSVMAGSESRTFDAVGLRSLTVLSTAGNVTITGSPGGTARVEVDKARFPPECTLDMERTNGILAVSITEPRWPGNTCHAHLDIKVPMETDIDLKVGAGDIEVINTTGYVAYELGSGDLEVVGGVSRLSGFTGAGNIRATGMAGDVDLKMDLGDIRLEYAQLPESGGVRIKNTTGDTTIIMPAGSVVLTNLHTGSGRIYNEVGDTAGADFQVAVDSGSGKISIRKSR